MSRNSVFFFSSSFRAILFFLLTQREKKPFRASKKLISAEVSKKKSCLKRTSKKNRYFGTSKPAKCDPVIQTIPAVNSYSK